MLDRRRLILQGIALAVALVLIFPLVTSAYPAAQPRSGETVHLVRRGETLAAIASRYGVPISQLIRYNALRNPDVIYVGQRLRIPVAGAQRAKVGSSSAITVLPAPTPTPVQQPTPMPASDPQAVPTPAALAMASAAAASPTVHVVKRGEHLASIASQYGISVQSLLQVNRLSNPSLLRVGQQLSIPAGSVASALQAAPAPAPVPAPQAAANAPTSGKWIDINVSKQTLSAYEGTQLVFTTKVSTGRSRTPTVIGRYRIRTKLRAQAMSGPGYYLPNVPYVMYFYGGYAIHGTYWHNNFGNPMSHGCVNMRTSEAKWLYDWAPAGTLVVTHR